MTKNVRTARGKIINWDLFRVKSQIAKAPKPVEVTQREEFIEKKLRRKLRRAKREAAAKRRQQKVVGVETVNVDKNITEQEEIKTSEIKQPETEPTLRQKPRRRVRRG